MYQIEKAGTIKYMGVHIDDIYSDHKRSYYIEDGSSFKLLEIRQLQFSLFIEYEFIKMKLSW